MREHNRLATLIKANNPGLADEAIYQTARKIVGRGNAGITYNEFLPALMGPRAPEPRRVRLRPQRGREHHQFVLHRVLPLRAQHAVARHQAGGQFRQHRRQPVAAQRFFNPSILKNDPAKVDQVMKGLAWQIAQENDVLLIDDIRNFLFGPPAPAGLTWAALDIQRGRDHGLLDYNGLRGPYGLQPFNSVNQLTAEPGPACQA